MKKFDNGEDFRNRSENKWAEGYNIEEDYKEISYYTYAQWYDFDFTWSILQFNKILMPSKKMIHKRGYIHGNGIVTHTQTFFSFN